MNGRRALLWIGIALALLATSRVAFSQSPGRVFQIGVVFNTPPAPAVSSTIWAMAVVEVLRERGWIEGRNIRVHWRSAEQHYDRLPAIIEELLSVPVDVLLVGGNASTRAAVEGTKTVPIVTVGMDRPVERGWVASLARPGGNLTGIGIFAESGLDNKRLSLLKEIAPHASRIALLDWIDAESLKTEILEAASKLGLDLFQQRLATIDHIEPAIDEAVRRGAHAIYVTGSHSFVLAEAQSRIHGAIKRHRLPAIYYYQGSSDTGGLATYSDDLLQRYRRATVYVDRILKGARPAELAVEQPLKLEFVINLKAAREIGLTISQSVLVQADRVIE